jgi:hypothetical protein
VGFPIARSQLSNATTQSEVLTEARPKSGATTRQGALKEAAPLTRTLQMPLCPRLLPALTAYMQIQQSELEGVWVSDMARLWQQSAKFQISSFPFIGRAQRLAGGLQLVPLIPAQAGIQNGLRRPRNAGSPLEFAPDTIGGGDEQLRFDLTEICASSGR